MNASTNQKVSINAQKREVLGKAVRSIRKTGMIPANVYGKGFEPAAISINSVEFDNTYRLAGHTTLVYVNVDKESIPTLIGDVQKHPISRKVIHADFRKVDLKKQITTKVPLVFVGTSEAVARKNGVLITQMGELTIEALPTDIPHEIEVDISSLVDIGGEIKVLSLPVSKSYTVKDDAEKVIVSVTEHVEETVEVQSATEAPEIITSKPAEGEEGAEGEAAPAPAAKKE